MGLFDPITDLFDTAVSGLFGTSGSFLGGSSGVNQFSAAPLSVNYPPYQPVDFPSPVYGGPAPMTVPVQNVPMVIGGAMKLATRFPALWAAIQALSAQFGKRFTPELLWRMIKQNGPGIVAGLIGAAAMNELAVWKTTHKSRRMNPANTRALRRSLRRLKSFDRLAGRVSSQLSHAGARRRRSSSRRCVTCKRNPCSC